MIRNSKPNYCKASDVGLAKIFNRFPIHPRQQIVIGILGLSLLRLDQQEPREPDSQSDNSASNSVSLNKSHVGFSKSGPQ